MNDVIRILCLIASLVCFYFATLIFAFHHMFETNRDKFDSYTITAVAEFALFGIILFRLGVAL